VFIHEDVYDEVIQGLADYAKKVKLGSGLDPHTEMGPLVSKEQQDRVVGNI